MKSVTRACCAGVVALALVTAAGTTSAYASTEVVSAPGLLAAPTGLTPDDSAAAYPHQVRKNVKLDWAPVGGATGYRVEVGRDSTWSADPVLTKDVLVSEYTLPLLLPNASYVWRVAALNGSVLGHWSSEAGQANADAEFTHGWGATPTLGAVTSPFVGLPTFTWSPMADAYGYELQLSKNSFLATTATGSTPDTSPSPGTTTQAPDPGLIAECFTARTRLTPFSDEVSKSGSVGECKGNVPLDGTTVYWRVRPLDAAASEAVSGATEPKSVAGLSATPPDDSSNLNKTCGSGSFSCDPSQASLPGAWSTPASFVWTTAADLGGTLAATVPTASLATDPDGLCRVVTDGTATEAEHAVCRDVPTIRWSQAAGTAVVYRVTVALDNAMSNIQHVVFTTATQWTVPGSWIDASGLTSYYYVVQACESTGCTSVTTNPPSFSKVTPRLTTISSPGVAGEMHFSFNSYASVLAAATAMPATQDAWAYHLQVAHADHPSYDALVDEVTVDELSYAPQKSYPDGSYVWRVQAIDSAGDKLPWSTSQAFTRDATPPKVVSVTPSSGVGVLQSLKLAFSETVTGVSSSSVTLTPATPTTVSSLGDNQTFTLVPTTPLVPGATYRVTVSSAVHDLSGNVADPVGPTFGVTPQVDDPSKAFSYGGAWRPLLSSSAIGHSYHGSVPTPTARTTSTMRFSGVGVKLVSCLGPANGYLDVYVDSVKKARVNLYRSYSGCGIRVATLTGLARRTHTLKLVGVGAHASASKGNAVAVDYVGVYV